MPIVEHINKLEPEMEKLTDDELRAKTQEFKEHLKTGSIRLTLKRQSTGEKALDEILPEAFAVVREAGKRVLNMRHFDVQLIGGIFLHNGHIAEMRTGEGKTLVATLPAYLNALTGKGVHVITVNDYLAKRDSEWMGKIYKFLGLSVGVILANQERGLDDFERKKLLMNVILPTERTMNSVLTILETTWPAAWKCLCSARITMPLSTKLTLS